MKAINSISILGDSILKGVIFDEETGRYKFLKENAVSIFENMFDITIINHSKFGCTVSKASEKLSQALAKKEDSDAYLIELGGNDCDFNWDEVAKDPFAKHIPNTPYDKFLSSVSKMVEEIIKSGKVPFIMNLPPIDYERYFNWITKNDTERQKNILAFLGDKSYIYRHQELYSRALEKVAKKYDLYTVNVRDIFLSIPCYSDYLCIDGIHPNVKGQELIEDIFAQAYKERVLKESIA